MTRSLLLMLAATGLVFAQGGWRKVGDRPPDAPPPQSSPVAQNAPMPEGGDPEPVDRSDAFGQPAQQQPPFQGPQQAPPQFATRPSYGVPPEVTLVPGTYMTVRIGQTLSSDHNQAGDTFVASLAQPVVVDGI